MLRYIKRLKNMGFSIYHIAKMRVDEIKNILNVDNGVAESIILYARMTVEKNMESRGKRYPNEIMKLPYIGVKSGEIIQRKFENRKYSKNETGAVDEYPQHFKENGGRYNNCRRNNS